MSAILEQLNSDDWETRNAGIQAAVENPDEHIVERLIELAQDASSIQDGRQSAAVALGQINTQRSTGFLFEAIQSDDPGLRELAAIGLSGLKTSSSMFALMDALTDKVNKVRNVAERSLLAMIDLVRAEGVDRLLELLKHPVPLTRSPAARLLGQTRDERALQPLREMLREDRQWLGRMWAAQGLRDLGMSEAVEPLCEAVQQDPKNRVRAAAAEALGRLRATQAEEVLQKALDDEDIGVRNKAAEALEDMHKAGFEDDTDPFDEE